MFFRVVNQLAILIKLHDVLINQIKYMQSVNNVYICK